MKRTPLKRKTPLARGTKGIKRTRLARVSVTKAAWRQLYRMKWMPEIRPTMQCADCGDTYRFSDMHRHHPAGQVGARIMVYVWIDGDCHRRIHDRATWARETGRLLPEFDGRKSTPDTPNYFGVTLP